MKKKSLERRKLIWLKLFSFFVIALTCSCKDEPKETGSYDPSRPVTFTNFTPTEGSIRTRFYIRGDNFGTDLTKIHVFIGGREATTIGSDGKEIYCMVPRRATDGIVKVVIDGDNGEPVIEYQFDERFNYISKTSVGTLCGKVDEYGNASNLDGDFETAQLKAPDWLLLDTFGTEKSLFVFDPGTSMRKVDLVNNNISTVITNGQGSFRNMKQSCFHPEGDTIYIVDDNGQNNQDMMAVSYLVRAESFRKAQPYVYDRCGYSCAYHPAGKQLYYNTYWKAAIQKAVYDDDIKGWRPQEVFPVYDNRDVHTYLSIHPSGDFMYIIGAHSIFKTFYSKEENNFRNPIVFAGKPGEAGYYDGPGTTARFNNPEQGVYVKNTEYVEAGMADVYDFYICDKDNHCIRKITPQGIVTTYAGRGSASSDGKVDGYIDGDIRLEARFNSPRGMAFNVEEQVFYIGDSGNHRIRTISIE